MKERIADFPDWFGPMLVKELRQGLKARGFVLSFVGFQVVLILVLIIYVLLYARQGKDFDPSGLSSIFWAFIGAQLLVVTPLRALNELAGERKANTLELIFMSGLSAWRIAFGKWVSLLFQALLFILAVLPYAILRYYFGGVNLAEDFSYLIGSLMLCGLISAVALAISGLPLFARIIAGALAGLMLVGWVPAILLSAVFGRSRIGGLSGLDDANWWMLCLDVGLLSFAAIEIGAASIAPLAENHSGRQRLLALLSAVPVPVMFFLKASADAIAAQTVFFGVFAGILAWFHLSDAPVPLKSYCRPFAGMRSILGIPFQPGWPSALVFLTLVVGIICGSALMVKPGSNDAEWLVACVLMGAASLCTSTLFWVVLRKKARRPLIEQTLFLIFCGVAVGMLYAGKANTSHLGENVALGVLPPMAIWTMFDNSSDTVWRWNWLIASLVAFAGYGGTLLLISRKYWVKYFRLCRELGQGKSVRAAEASGDAAGREAEVAKPGFEGKGVPKLGLGNEGGVAEVETNSVERESHGGEDGENPR